MRPLRDFFNRLPPAERSGFALRCGTTVGYLRKAMSKGSVPTTTLCIAIERESAGKVRCEELDPHADWGFLRAAMPRMTGCVTTAGITRKYQRLGLYLRRKRLERQRPKPEPATEPDLQGAALRNYLLRHGIAQADFGKRLKPRATQGLVSQWLHGKTKVTPERAIEIERITGGEVRCEDLRPDIDWHVVRGPGVRRRQGAARG